MMLDPYISRLWTKRASGFPFRVELITKSDRLVVVVFFKLILICCV